MFQNGNCVSESQFRYICQWIIKDQVNRNCRKEPYLAESMYKFIFIQEIKRWNFQNKDKIVIIMVLKALVVLIYSYATEAKGL